VAEARPAEPPTPKVTRGGDLSGPVLDAFRSARGLPPDAEPAFNLRVQVTGDARPERVVLLGRDLVVFGPGFRGGTGYVYATLTQFADASDIKEVSARDLTGDGGAEIVVRGVHRLTAEGAALGSELLTVYRMQGESLSRIFAIETAREQGSKRVQGLVQFVPSPGGKTFDVLAAPGRASGWTEKTYPWSQEQPGTGDVEPLLLPWGGITQLRYTWNGSQFAATPD
jgi:hypothetical protein